MKSNLEIGALYETGEHYWLLYPSSPEVRHSMQVFCVTESFAVTEVKHWSEKLRSSVSYMSPDTVFMPLETSGYYHKILTGAGIVGWIMVDDLLAAEFTRLSEK